MQVTSIHFSPVDPNLMLSAGNDWAARLFDMRTLSDSPSASKGEHQDWPSHYSSFKLLIQENNSMTLLTCFLSSYGPRA